MPDITITDEQAAALARGENITLSAPKPDPVVKRYVVVKERSGCVVEYETHDGVPQPYTVLRAGSAHVAVGWRSNWGHDFINGRAVSKGAVVTEIPA